MKLLHVKQDEGHGMPDHPPSSGHHHLWQVAETWRTKSKFAPVIRLVACTFFLLKSNAVMQWLEDLYVEARDCLAHAGATRWLPQHSAAERPSAAASHPACPASVPLNNHPAAAGSFQPSSCGTSQPVGGPHDSVDFGKPPTGATSLERGLNTRCDGAPAAVECLPQRIAQNGAGLAPAEQGSAQAHQLPPAQPPGHCAWSGGKHLMQALV